ncbi:Metallo-dependent phosphatase-like protein [Podospora fimiseda]|uniref:Metallo-dependent phosphatase-like protein n=1 Tax=Podospora fimiseda TaxID=252190 RepID=A0AAN7GU16_9PEZI|nr:Metallo-dependent phosphatase-like protein [Podospora fimiseda]
MPPISFQIISDVHLESPKGYDVFLITPKAPYLALLGDIGVVNHRDELTDFLLQQVAQFRIVFFVPGNHEAYGSEWRHVKELLDRVVDLTNSRRKKDPTIGQFVPLVRGRYDFHDEDGDKVTVLGCTLFSNVPEPSMMQVGLGLNDFYVTKGWTVADHNKEHLADLQWLNEQVVSLEGSGRKIVIFTHHSPTIDERANDPRHAGSKISSGFRTDLSGEKCWKSTDVKLWAFGHTHYNCDYVDEHGKRVYTHQRGYYFAPAEGYDGERVVGL